MLRCYRVVFPLSFPCFGAAVALLPQYCGTVVALLSLCLVVIEVSWRSYRAVFCFFAALLLGCCRAVIALLFRCCRVVIMLLSFCFCTVVALLFVFSLLIPAQAFFLLFLDASVS